MVVVAVAVSGSSSRGIHRDRRRVAGLTPSRLVERLPQKLKSEGAREHVATPHALTLHSS